MRRISDRGPVFVLWVLLGTAFALVTSRVGDWFDMTDELRYERLALSIVRDHSVVPRIHSVGIDSYAQLYPLLIAPVFAGGYVPHDLHLAHLLNAWLMTSACIPVFLLTRRVTGIRWAAYVVALLSVLIPWMLYSTMLMTEVVAYPAFAWTALAMQRSTVEPSRWNDVVALLALGLSFFARTALFVLVLALPVAIVVYELTGAPKRRLSSAILAARKHSVLVGAYALLLVGATVVVGTGNWSRIFGVYGMYANNQSVLGHGWVGSFAAHLATFSLGIGIFPFVIGTAWFLAN